MSHEFYYAVTASVAVAMALGRFLHFLFGAERLKAIFLSLLGIPSGTKAEEAPKKPRRKWSAETAIIGRLP